jgi:beta-lactamase regulating signal transducer with metallopeptidase domain
MENIINAIAWTILHSFWQGALLFILLLLLSFTGINNKPSKRYLLLAFSSVCFLITSICTFIFYYQKPLYSENGISKVMNFILLNDQVNPEKSLFSTIESWVDQNQNHIALIWVLGVVLFLLKTFIAYLFLIKRERKAQFLNISNYGIDFNAILQKMSISHQVQIKSVVEIISPYTSGVIKPVIYFPIALLTQLNQEEIESIIIHELAHIKRNDFILNWILVIVESIYFYHPVMWWIQNQINISREEACDDIVKQSEVQPLVYVNALFKIQKLLCNQKETFSSLEMAALANKNQNQIMNRIKRIFNMPYNQYNLREKLTASIFILIFAVTINGLYAKSEKVKVSNPVEIPTLFLTSLDTIKPISKKKSTQTIIKSDGDKNVELKMEDGEITSLKIDDKVIDKGDYDKYQDVIDETKPAADGEGVSLRIKRNGNPRIFMNGEMIDFSDINEKMKELKLENFGENGEKIKIFSDGEGDLFDMLDKVKKNLGGFDTTFTFKLGELGGKLDKMDFNFGNMDSLLSNSFKSLGDNIWIREGNGMNNEWNDNDWPLKTLRKKGIQATLKEQLAADGFKVNEKNIDVEITDKGLKIDGDKQAENMFNKYKKLIEIETGLQIEEGTKLNYRVSSKERKKIKG